jgi:hypothetical protein
MHPLFKQYNENAPSWCRKLLKAAILRLIGQPMVETNGPTTLLTALNRQPGKQRAILHLLHYVPERRGAAFDIVEDVLPLHDLEIDLHGLDKPSQITLEPEGQPLAFTVQSRSVRIHLPRLHGHGMVVLQF